MQSFSLFGSLIRSLFVILLAQDNPGLTVDSLIKGPPLKAADRFALANCIVLDFDPRNA
jgi:hypothetical protein